MLSNHDGHGYLGCCVFVLSLSLSLVVVAVASVKLVKNFPDSGLQTSRQELDIPLNAEVHDLINPFRDAQLDVRAQSDLERRVLMLREGST
jgi:hypothetical protein